MNTIEYYTTWKRNNIYVIAPHSTSQYGGDLVTLSNIM